MVLVVFVDFGSSFRGFFFSLVAAADSFCFAAVSLSLAAALSSLVDDFCACGDFAVSLVGLGGARGLAELA